MSAQAIAATTTALMRVLSEEFPANLGVTGIESHDPAARGGPPRLVLWLYRFVPVAALRPRAAGLRPTPDARPGVRPSAVAVDLHYLLWTREATPAVAQGALGWALRRLADRPIITTERLNQAGAGLKPNADVALLVEELPLAELVALTAPLGMPPPLVLPIHARGVQLEGE
jgi:hypothetical protein